MTMNRTDFDTRVFLVNEIIRNGKTVTTVAKENNLNRGTLSDWVRKYKKSGPESLKPYRKKYSYTYQEKIAAVKRVILNGKSILGTVEEFNISSKAVLKAWIKNYNRQKELKNTGSRLSTMKSKKSSKKTSIQERLEIVQYTIAHNYNYQAAIKKYGVSYQQIYTWIRKYNSKGIQGLQDKRGRNQIIEELSEIDKLKLENNKLRDRNEFLEMEIDIEKKVTRAQSEQKTFSLSYKESYYQTILELHTAKGYKIKSLCDSIGVSRSGYYKWLNKEKSVQEIKIEKLAIEIKRIFEESDKTFGVVRIQCALKRELNITISSKKVRRLMRIMNLYPEIRKKRSDWVRTVPEHTFENVISRDFVASKPNKKWFTDVSYLFYGNHQKAYISAIIDRYDLSIVSYVISTKNDNKLVMDTVKKALELNPEATPIIHSDRGFQYTSNEYNLLSKSSNFTISMSRVSKCLDNQPIESFWGVLKSEYYYRYKFKTLDSLEKGIEKYIEFYQNKRYVPKFNGLTPLEFRKIAI